MIIASFFENVNPFYFWFILGIVLAIAEMLTPGFVLLAFAGGCAVAALSTFFVGFNFQILAFCIGSLICFFTFRRMLSFKQDPPETAFGIEALKGKNAKVLETVSEDEGYVQLGGERWPARIKGGQNNLDPGTPVQVVSIDGNKVLVEPL